MRLRVLRDPSGPYVRYANKIFRPRNAQMSSLNGFVNTTTDFSNMDYVAVQCRTTDEILYSSWKEGRGSEVEPGVFEDDLQNRRLSMKELLMEIIVAIDEGRLDEDLAKFSQSRQYYERPVKNDKKFVTLSLNVGGPHTDVKTKADYEQFAQRQLEYWLEQISKFGGD